MRFPVDTVSVDIPPRISSFNNSTDTSLISSKSPVLMVATLFLLLIPRLWADDLKEYIYMDGKLVAVETDTSACDSMSIAATSKSFGTGAGTGSVGVTAVTGCIWAVTNNASSWVTVSGGASGSGNGTVSYSVAANTGAARNGTLTIAGKTYTVSQSSGCAPSIAATSNSLGAGAGTGSVGVTAGTGCTWTAKSNVTWVTVTGGASGSGNGTVSYSVAANTGAARSGTLTIGGKTYTVSQSGSCTPSIVSVA